jgi:hypothetical protein
LHPTFISKISPKNDLSEILKFGQSQFFWDHGLNKLRTHLLFGKYFLIFFKQYLKNLTNHNFFGPWATKFCAYLQKKIILRFWEILWEENPANHCLLGPWANELCTHLQKNIVKNF